MTSTSSSHIQKNIWVMSLVSFFMNLSASLISSSANTFLISQMGCSLVFLGIVRGGSESIGYLLRVAIGMLSDYLHNRKIFLIIGYGGMIVIKILFGITASGVLNQNCNQVLYAFTHSLDRFLNASRDSVRDATIAESSKVSNRGLAFGLRKLLACLGSVSGGLLAFFFLRQNIDSTKIYTYLYFGSLLPCTIAILIIIFGIKDFFKEKYDKKIALSSQEMMIENYISPNPLPIVKIMPMLYVLVLFCIVGFFNNMILSRLLFGYFQIFYGVMNGLLFGLITRVIKMPVHLYSISFTSLVLYTLVSMKFSIVLISKLFLGVGALCLFLEIIAVQFFLLKIKKKLIDIFDGIYYICLTVLGFFIGHNFFYYMCSTVIYDYYNLIITTILISVIILFRSIFFALYDKAQHKIAAYQDKIKDYNKLLFAGFLVSLGKYSEVFIFKHIVDTFKMNSYYTPLVFALYYGLFGVSSFYLSKLTDYNRGNRGILFIFLAPVSLIFFNIFMASFNFYPKSILMTFIALFIYSIHIGSIECSFLSSISKIIKVDSLKGTMLGLFYLFVSLGNACASYLIATTYPSITFAYGIGVIPACLSAIYIVYYRKSIASAIDY